MNDFRVEINYKKSVDFGGEMKHNKPGDAVNVKKVPRVRKDNFTVMFPSVELSNEGDVDLLFDEVVMKKVRHH